MARYIDISLGKRGVTAVARLLDDLAPRTCRTVWDALPLGSEAYHAKYARNEIYTLVEAFGASEPGRENPTITPIPGDVVYFTFEPWQLATPSHGYSADERPHQADLLVDLAVFYERNNLLLNPDYGSSRATCSPRSSRASRSWPPRRRTCGSAGSRARRSASAATRASSSDHRRPPRADGRTPGWAARRLAAPPRSTPGWR